MKRNPDYPTVRRSFSSRNKKRRQSPFFFSCTYAARQLAEPANAAVGLISRAELFSSSSLGERKAAYIVFQLRYTFLRFESLGPRLARPISSARSLQIPKSVSRRHDVYWSLSLLSPRRSQSLLSVRPVRVF